METEEAMKIGFREANLRDKEGILRIASRTWEGWDYVPLFLGEWLSQGGLFIAEAKGKIVGMTKTSALYPGELWLEGLRVAKKFRGQGIGERLAKFQLDEALSRKPRSIRLSTAEVNRASIRIIQGLDFSLFCTFTYLEAEVRKPKKAPLLRPLRSVEKGWRLVKESQFVRYSQGLLPAGWIFYRASQELIAQLVCSGMMLESEIGLAILQPHRYDPKGSAEIVFFSTSPEGIPNLLEGINSIAFEAGYEELSSFLPQDYGAEGFTQWGFKQKLKFKYVFVYEYPLSSKAPPSRPGPGKPTR